MAVTQKHDNNNKKKSKVLLTVTIQDATQLTLSLEQPH